MLVEKQPVGYSLFPEVKSSDACVKSRNYGKQLKGSIGKVNVSEVPGKNNYNEAVHGNMWGPII